APPCSASWGSARAPTSASSCPRTPRAARSERGRAPVVVAGGARRRGARVVWLRAHVGFLFDGRAVGGAGRAGEPDADAGAALSDAAARRLPLHQPRLRGR